MNIHRLSKENNLQMVGVPYSCYIFSTGGQENHLSDLSTVGQHWQNDV